jgi:hypothetical protein
MMADLSLRPVLLGVLLVVLVLLLVAMVARRRRAGVSSTPPALSSEAVDDTLPAFSADVAEHPEPAAPALGPVRGSRGRHAADPAAPVSALLHLVPVSAKRRHRPVEVTSRPVPVPTEPVDDIPAVDDVPAVDAAADAVAAAAQEMHTYQRRVAATVQAISRRIEPGESPEVVEARMLAALARLDDPLDFVRPRLSPSGSHHWPDRSAPAPEPAVLEAVVHATPEEEDAPSLDSGLPVPASEPDERVPDDAESAASPPQEPAPDETEVVLPAPPLPPAPSARRRGIRARGKAG